MAAPRSWTWLKYVDTKNQSSEGRRNIGNSRTVVLLPFIFSRLHHAQGIYMSGCTPYVCFVDLPGLTDVYGRFVHCNLLRWSPSRLFISSGEGFSGGHCAGMHGLP